MTRVCATCPTRLSRYNETELCGACRVAELDRQAANLEVRYTTAEKIERHLEGHQASAPQLAKVAGCSQRHVHRVLLDLIAEGRVTRGRVELSTGKRLYMLATRDEEAA